ncbi:MAG: AAA family ATPase [Armatimonadetes bacterium]|nr:AAA family ATPase [Armatimonadota bacterium]
MFTPIQSVKVNNYRLMVGIDITLKPINVLFGPNGAGKSSFLDVSWFVRDCAIRGVDFALSQRSHGIGLLYDGATEGDAITIALETETVKYELTLVVSSGRLDLGESLSTAKRGELIHRSVGSKVASFQHLEDGKLYDIPLREPDKLSLGRYLDFEGDSSEVSEIDTLLRRTHHYHSRSFNLFGLRNKGSLTGQETYLSERGDNLWSALRNLESRRSVDTRYDTIMRYMRRAMPMFEGVIIEPTSPTTLYASFLERGRRKEINVSGVSDGYLQMLLLLTALFGQPQDWGCLLLLDEPDIALHPWALAVLAEAVKEATSQWSRQVMVATHSPVLLSQFETNEVIATDIVDGKAKMEFLSDKPEVQDLLEEYATGSLYMAQVLAPQREEALV